MPPQTWPHLSCFLKFVLRVFSSFSFCSPSINVEEFLDRQVGDKATVSREGCEQIFLPEWSIMHLAPDQDPTAAPGQPGPDGQEEPGGTGDQTGETQEKETNQLAVLGVEVMGVMPEGATTTGAGLRSNIGREVLSSFPLRFHSCSPHSETGDPRGGGNYFTTRWQNFSLTQA